MNVFRRAAAEGIGTALLLAAVIGSGIMGERLAGGNVAIALLANTIATGAALVALISALGPVSGAHFNPVVTAVEAARKELSWGAAGAVVAAQLAGACAGAVAANVMFGTAPVSLSTKARGGLALFFSEVVATFGLVLVIRLCAARRPAAIPAAVAGWIMAAYWFTASTSFANPAAAVGRMLSDSFAGIRPADAPGFIAAEVLGGALGAGVAAGLLRDRPAS